MATSSLAGGGQLRLEPVAAAERARLLALAPSVEAHRAALAALPFLHAVQVEAPARSAAPLSLARVVCWNAQRGRRLDASAALLARQNADVMLLQELDWGMARTDQRHTAAELARRLGCGFVYGVEFLELGLGDAQERARHAGQANAVGYHGAALLCTRELSRARLVRLDLSGGWFPAERGERRVGGRMALLASLELGGAALTLGCVHLESHSDPQDRRAQLARLFDAIDAYDPGAAVLIGGDLNTCSLPLASLLDKTLLRQALAQDPDRLRNPVPYEPLFALASERGYDWRACNQLDEATHRRESGRSGLRLDWFLTRGLLASDPAVIDAVEPQSGRALSDHELIALRIRRPEPALNPR